MKRLHLILIFTLIATSVLLLALRPVPAHAQSRAPVLIYYYAWWSPDAVGPGKSPDWPVTPYHSWDTAVIRQHVAQIASAGIDGMVVAWYGPQEQYNQTETNFRVILDEASANGIKALLSVDLGNSAWFKTRQEVIDGLKYALSTHAAHPAYFRYNGRPVLFFWFQGRYSLDDWAVIRQEVDPQHTSIWIAEGAALDTIPTFDGLHMYTIAWSQNVSATLAQWSASTHARGGLWVSTVMPGWDNTYTQQSERYVREREDGAFYRETFAAAAASGAEMFIITSWNEWWEGTHIEPSHNYGDAYLNLTRQLIAEYKSSGAVAAGSGSAPPVRPTSTAPGTPASLPSQLPIPITSVTPSPAAPKATSTLPPTITPTQIPTFTMTPTSVPTQIASIADQNSSVNAKPADEETALRLFKDPSFLIVGGGLLAGALGLFMLGLVSVMLTRSRKHQH